MNIKLIASFAAGILLAGPAFANEPVANDKAGVDAASPAQVPPHARGQSQPIRLSAAELDRVTAGDLVLPNEKVMFPGFDNPAPGDFHPNFDRSPTGAGASGNEGPWEAAFNSPAIGFQCSICP